MTDAYPWLVTLGAIAGLLWLGLFEPRTIRTKTTTSPISQIDAGLVALVAGFLGARLGFVLVHMHYYSIHVDEILMYWNGGLSWVGGAIGAFLGLSVYAALKTKSLWVLTDHIAIPAAFLAFSAWFGCLLDGCVYGKHADFGFLTPLTPDTLGQLLHRWPVQGLGALLALATILVLIYLRFNNLPSGAQGILCLSLISGSNLLLSFFRGDQVPILNGLRSDGLSSAFLLILSLVTLTLQFRNWDQQ